MSKKNKKYEKMKNYKFHKEKCITSCNSCKQNNQLSQNIIILDTVNQFKFMLKSFILKYYNGVFTIKKNNDIKMEKTLNFLLSKYIEKGKVGLYKLIDEYYVIDINITRRRNNNIPYQFNGYYCDDKGVQKSLIFNGELSDSKKNTVNYSTNFITNFDNIKILENSECVTMLSYVNSLIELACTMFQSIIRKIAVQNTASIVLVNKENFETIKTGINKTVSMANGAITFIASESTGQAFQTINVSDNIADYILKMTDQLDWCLKTIKDILGMRYNSNFKLERNISNEYEQDDAVFSIFERNLKDEIQYFINEINDSFFKNDENKVYLEINTKFLTNNDKDISFNNIKNFYQSSLEKIEKNNEIEDDNDF